MDLSLDFSSRTLIRQKKSNLVFTLWCIASFWLTSWERRISTSSLRTCSSSQEALSWSRRTLYAGEPGAPAPVAASPSRLCLISARSCLSFLFSDSSSWRWEAREFSVRWWHLTVKKSWSFSFRVCFCSTAAYFQGLVLQLCSTCLFKLCIILEQEGKQWWGDGIQSVIHTAALRHMVLTEQLWSHAIC